jgi:ion channel POLLUX/CASTOR
MRRFTLRQRLRYAFDNSMSRGTVALIGWLALAAGALIAAVSGLVMLIAPFKEDGTPYGFAELFWMGLMRTLDAGTMGGDGGSWPFLFSMFAATLGGVFLVSTLIGVLTAGVEAKIEELRKGRSLVVETDHTVVLGWSEQIFTVLRELIAASENKANACVAILADRDKVEMEDELRAKVPHRGQTRVVCRRGSPIDPHDLDLVNPQGSRAIIVLDPGGDEPDAEVIKTILAITNARDRRREPYHIVAQLRHRKNLEAARLVGGDEAHLVETGEVIARVIVQTCRQAGLSQVYMELLDFEGDEIYFQVEPKLVGETFGEALLADEDSSVIGLQRADGQVRLNPPMSTKIEAGDKVIALSFDDDTIKLSALPAPKIDRAAFSKRPATALAPERTLILGWNGRAATVVRELDAYVAPGSKLTVMAADFCADAETEVSRCAAEARNQNVTFVRGDTSDRATLEAIEVEKFQHVIVLCYSDDLEMQRADARTLVTLLHLRDIEAKLGDRFSTVSEMLDLRNRELAEVTQADDFIVSDQLTSLMLAQISENKDLTAVFADLFDSEGSEIYLKPAEDYVALDRPVSFYTVVAAARERGHVAIGYRVLANSGRADRRYGVVVNPDKSDEVTFSAGDTIVVVAEN